ncbi:pyridoxal phosphate-dependent transferase [Zopfochytrium polystomum]|nr:pyridoxal phosphate-dependent transferase [Zopfochytrium polystomum]
MASTSTALPTAVWNYSAGPGVLPRKVLERAQADMLNFAGLQHSIMEMSHRSKEFEAVLAKAEADFRALLAIPSTYKVLFMQGGATSQFSAVVYNLIGGDLSKPVDYVVTGVWSQKAAEEAKAMGANVHRVVDTKPTNHDGSLPPVDQWKFHADAQYAYFCDNETVHGVEFNPFPFDAVPAGVPLVCDMSSSILSRPVDVSRTWAPPEVTVVITRPRRNPSLRCPLMLDYKIFADNNSMYNTPPTWAIYVAGLVFDWLRNDVGGLEAMAAINAQKSKLVYDAIDGSNGFYRGPVKPALRSRMNVPFRIYKDGVASKELEVVFAKEAEARGLVQLAGHRSVGGMRASLYNSLPLEGAQVLVRFMGEFAKAHA